MLGWTVHVHRQDPPSTSPATKTSPQGVRLATWEAGVYGLSWLDELLKQGHADCFSSHGYPERYTAQARHILPRLLHGPRGARESAGYVADPTIDPDEWLIVDAWDQS